MSVAVSETLLTKSHQGTRVVARAKDTCKGHVRRTLGGTHTQRATGGHAQGKRSKLGTPCKNTQIEILRFISCLFLCTFKQTPKSASACPHDGAHVSVRGKSHGREASHNDVCVPYLHGRAHVSVIYHNDVATAHDNASVDAHRTPFMLLWKCLTTTRCPTSL